MKKLTLAEQEFHLWMNGAELTVVHLAPTVRVLPGGKHLARTSLFLNAPNAFMSRRATRLATFPALRRLH